jgi:hypothetical protein
MFKHYTDKHGVKYSTAKKGNAIKAHTYNVGEQAIIDRKKQMNIRLAYLLEQLASDEITALEYDQQKAIIKAEYQIPKPVQSDIDVNRLVSGDIDYIVTYLEGLGTELVEVINQVSNGEGAKVFNRICQGKTDQLPNGEPVTDEILYKMYRTICNGMMKILIGRQREIVEKGYNGVLSFDDPDNQDLQLSFFQPQELIQKIGNTLSVSNQLPIILSIKALLDING